MKQKIYRRLHSKKTWLLIGIAVALCIIGISTAGSLLQHKNTIQSASPDFDALAPQHMTPDWKQSTPQGARGGSSVYIYTDNINGTTIKVSEQPLPPSFRDDPAGKVAEVAQGFNATNAMQVDGVTVYIGTSAKGPQSVIFSNGSLLVLIKSDAAITNGAWADYIKALR